MIITLAEKTNANDNGGMYPYGTTLELPDVIRATITGSIGDIETNEVYGYSIEWELLSNGYRFWSDEHCDRLSECRFNETARIISEAALLGSNPERLESHLRSYGANLYFNSVVWKNARFDKENQQLISTRYMGSGDQDFLRQYPRGQKFQMQWKLRRDINDPRGQQTSIGFISLSEFNQE